MGNDYKIVEEENALETQIRREMGAEIFDNSKLEISMSGGSPVYNGELSIGKYRECFPNEDNLETVYLTLKKKYPGLAKVVGKIYDLKKEKEMMIKEQDFGRAAELRNEIREISGAVVEKLSVSK